MPEEKKLREKKRMEERVEKENEEDYKTTLWYNLEKEMREIFEQFFKESKTPCTLYNYGRKLMVLELQYRKVGVSWGDIHFIRRDIVNGKNGRTKTNIN